MLKGFLQQHLPPPHDNMVCVKTKTRIRNNATGEIRPLHKDYEPDYLVWDEEKQEPCLFIFQQGNFCCDCNRALFFFGAEHEHECGHGGFSVEIRNASDNEVIWEDFSCVKAGRDA